jgi:rhamnulokinase
MAEKAYLAIDIGASSGRHVAGLFDGRCLRLEEVYRFENGAIPFGDRLYWDLLGQWSQVCHGLRAAAARWGSGLESVGVDTWGVDFGLLGRGDELLGNPGHYRDRRTNGMMEKAFGIVSRAEIFRHTGLQFMQINTLYQLLAMKLAGSPVLDVAESLLMVPDLFHWLLTGVKCNEMTDASTTQFYDPVHGDWATELFEKFSLPTRILGEIVRPGTTLGPLRPAVAAETGLRSAKVVLPGSHDTASAVMAVPCAGWPAGANPQSPSANHPSSPAPRPASPDWCYVSLGTWALLGVELPQPVINESVLKLNFTNEGGVGGTTRLLKNIGGLWLVQECRRRWNQAGAGLDWETINRLAAAETPLRSFVNPDAPELHAPADMPEAIRAFCRLSGQPVPEGRGAIVRAALESIAMKFRHVLGMCEELIGSRLETVHVVGGGVQNRLLCQFAADATGRRVLAGPVEATAIGNLMMQAVAAGDVASIAEAREIIRRSFPVDEYTPNGPATWDAAYERFLKCLGPA